MVRISHYLVHIFPTPSTVKQFFHGPTTREHLEDSTYAESSSLCPIYMKSTHFSNCNTIISFMNVNSGHDYNGNPNSTCSASNVPVSQIWKLPSGRTNITSLIILTNISQYYLIEIQPVCLETLVHCSGTWKPRKYYHFNQMRVAEVLEHWRCRQPVSDVRITLNTRQTKHNIDCNIKEYTGALTQLRNDS